MSDAVQHNGPDAGPQAGSSRSTAIAAPSGDSLSPAAVTVGPLPEAFGRYRVLRSLGQGAMGTVYLAHDTQLDRQIAIKVPKFSSDDCVRTLERFYREARSAAALRHPHICPVFDVGEIDGICYLTMAYIEGRPLSRFISPDKPLLDRQVAGLVRKLALALEEAHAHGIVHRDLKPGNIMIDRRGEPVILDFGLARQIEKPDATRLTQVGMILGSPAYMSPEQVEADHDALGPPSDIYSLGVVMYELLSGQVPFHGSAASVIGAIMTRDPQPPSAIRPGVNRRLEAICQKMMVKAIGDRYPSMTAVAGALGEFLRNPADGLGGPCPHATVLRINEDEIGFKDDDDRPAPALYESAGRTDANAAASTDTALDSQLKKLDQRKAAVKSLVREHRYAEAGKVLRTMAAARDPRLKDYVEWARKQLPRLKPIVQRMQRDRQAALQQAQAAIQQNDYDRAIQVLQKLPRPCRTEAVQCLLDRAVELAAEVDRLLAEIKHAIEQQSPHDVQPRLERLLKLKPDDPRVRQVCQRLRSRGAAWFPWREPHR